MSDFLFKTIVVGDSRTGKSTFCERLLHDRSATAEYIPTIGVDIGIRIGTYRDASFKAQVWDTAGDARFREITSSYFRGASAVFVLFDCTRRETFDRLDAEWLDKLQPDFADSQYQRLVLLCGHADETRERAVSADEVAEFVRRHPNMMSFEVSKLDSQATLRSLFDSVIGQLIEPMLVDQQRRTGSTTRRRSLFRSLFSCCCSTRRGIQLV